MNLVGWLGRISLILFCTTRLFAQTPFTLPWNDFTPGPTDLSALNTPIGSSWVSVNINGHFEVDGSRIRFLGVNFAGDSPFMPTNNADAVAGRLAKFGLNNVRFHHMDAPWAYGGGLLAYGTTSTNLRSSQLERLHYLVWRLKEHGIYSDINLLVGREYRAGDGLGSEVTGMDGKDQHILGMFYPPALELQKDYATKVLGTKNRFTGVALAQDPAVAFVEVLNENGAVQKWLDGGLDRLPARYAPSLQSRWNKWLGTRYASDAALAAAWGVVNQPLGANLLRNGAFSNALTSWNGEQNGGARATFVRTYDFNGKPSAKIQVTGPTSTSWHIQFNQPNLPVTGGQAYTLTFWARSSPATNFDFSVMQAHSPYESLGLSTSTALTESWQEFKRTFQVSGSDANARVNFGGMGNKLATFWVAEVRLQPGGQLGQMPPGSSLASGTVPNIQNTGTGYTGTREARRDWLRFLRELESAYYYTMVGHIRTNLGYKGLVFGTIMANSPATVQSRLDVIDGHAYWQHPQFPGTPWDSVNWYVPNVSMVTTLGEDNTLAGLARQRIRGKPFTVTEYQHPSPMYYGAEGPLMIAAYGGLQDWDGLWMFDYGHGNANSSATMGYVRGYFEIGQHPTKMANMLLAAHLFRRGDVSPAVKELAVNLTSDKELDLLSKTWAWAIFGSGQLGVSGQLAFSNRLSTALDGSGAATAPTVSSATSVQSDTAQLKWTAGASGLFVADTPRTKLLAGFADSKEVKLGSVTFKPGATRLGWCTLGATLTRGEVFTNDCRFLVIGTGWWENTGQVWTDASKKSVGNQWGGPPVLVEAVPFQLILPVSTNYVKAWVLGPTGQRAGSLMVSGNSSSSTITMTNTGTLWYEVEVSRWMASFDLWRARYFSAEELADPAVTGAGATPERDGVPNLAKYYFGLPGNVAAGPEMLPQGAAMTVGGECFAVLTYGRDKLVRDVVATGEVSNDLLTWSSETGFLETVQDLGERERVTLRDALPLTQNRFLRLRLQKL